ncbi:MAG: hypothetical protein QG602_1396 [Verrucomicrobiota bacterium]|nr:hypothetical protein [Verrucomicrobiota bacterium]
MTINVRTFLRDFSTFKVQAVKGGTVRIRDKDGEFIFTAVGQRHTLLGAARGKITFHADLTKPTLADENWKPSL